MNPVSDHNHTIQLIKQPEGRYYRPDTHYWDVQVYCSLTRSTYVLATFKDEADAVDFAHDKAIDLGVAWERLP